MASGHTNSSKQQYLDLGNHLLSNYLTLLTTQNIMIMFIE